MEIEIDLVGSEIEMENDLVGSEMEMENDLVGSRFAFVECVPEGS